MKFEQRDKSLVIYTEDDASKEDAPVADHNHQWEMERLYEQGILKAGEVMEVDVMHDDWCSNYSGKRCDCNPEFAIRRQGEF